jgi:tetratricopeptide (TPR) repeat protein
MVSAVFRGVEIMKAEKLKSVTTSQADAKIDRWRFVMLIAPLCWIVYANSLGNQFVFDDFLTIVNNAAIQNFHIRDLFTNWFRPIRDLSLALDYWFWGLNPSGFRLTNILIHSVNSCLVYVLVTRIAGDGKTAVLAALLFAVHPIQTDAVAYISGRRDVLFTCFYLLSFYWYIRFREETGGRFALGSVAAFALSVMTKEMAVTLPVILLLWDVYARWDQQATMSPARQLWVRLVEIVKASRWLLLAGGLVVVGLIARYTLQGRGLGSPNALRLEYWGGSARSNFLTVLTVHGYYLKQLSAPVTLVASYQGAFPIARSLLEWRVIFSSALCLALIGLMIFGLRRDKLISFALAFYFITLLPVSQIIPHHELLAEHYLYLPMLGFALLIGHVLARLSLRGGRWRQVVYIGFAMLIIALSVRTMIRNRDWKDALTLWQATYQAAPTSPRAAYNLGVEYLKRNEYAQSIFYLQRAIELEPSHILAYNNLAAAQLAQGKPELALGTLQQAMRLSPSKEDRVVWAKRDATYRMILRNMAKCYLELGQPETALQSVQRAIKLSSGDALSYSLLARIYERLNQIDPAIDACRQGLAIDPSSPDLRVTLAQLLSQQGRMNEAVAEWQAVLKVAPTHPQANLSLAVYALDRNDAKAAHQYLHSLSAQSLSDAPLAASLAQAVMPYPGSRAFLLTANGYRILKKPQPAIRACQDGLRRYPDDRELRLTLALLYVDTQNLDAAAAEWRKVRQAQPNDYLANLNLGTYYMTEGDAASAEHHWNIALANAPDEAARQQVRQLVEQAKQHPP